MKKIISLLFGLCISPMLVLAEETTSLTTINSLIQTVMSGLNISKLGSSISPLHPAIGWFILFIALYLMWTFFIYVSRYVYKTVVHSKDITPRLVMGAVIFIFSYGWWLLLTRYDVETFSNLGNVISPSMPSIGWFLFLIFIFLTLWLCSLIPSLLKGVVFKSKNQNQQQQSNPMFPNLAPQENQQGPPVRVKQVAKPMPINKPVFTRIMHTQRSQAKQTVEPKTNVRDSFRISFKNIRGA